MKNKYNISQVSHCYCQEIGMEIPFMEEYLLTVFKKGKIDKEKLDELDRRLKDMVVTNSEFFPEWN